MTTLANTRHIRYHGLGTIADLGYWLGVYVSQRHEWMRLAREDKRMGYNPTTSVGAARRANTRLVDTLRKLNAIDYPNEYGTSIY